MADELHQIRTRTRRRAKPGDQLQQNRADGGQAARSEAKEAEEDPMARKKPDSFEVQPDRLGERKNNPNPES
jgi:hypothetical protein